MEREIKKSNQAGDQKDFWVELGFLFTQMWDKQNHNL